MLTRQVDERLGPARKQTVCIPDSRDLARVQYARSAAHGPDCLEPRARGRASLFRALMNYPDCGNQRASHGAHAVPLESRILRLTCSVL